MALRSPSEKLPAAGPPTMTPAAPGPVSRTAAAGGIRARASVRRPPVPHPAIIEPGHSAGRQ